MKKFTFLLALLCAAASSQAQVYYNNCDYIRQVPVVDALGDLTLSVDSFQQTAVINFPATITSYYFLDNGNSTRNYNCKDTALIGIIAVASTGEQDTCYGTAPASYLDTFLPTARCQNISVTLNPSTQSITVAAIDLDNGSTDNCNLTYNIIDGSANLPTKTYTAAGVYNETLRVFDPRNNVTCAATVTVLAPVGVTVYESGQTVRIMPNPFDNVVRVELTTAMAENQPIQLYSLDGRLVQQAEIPAGANIFELNTTELPTGVYLLQLRNSAFQLSERIIKR